MEIRLKCFSCGQDLQFIDQISRRDECSKCGADVLCCRNCEFYDPKSYNECRETQADPVREKDRSNFCAFFKVRSAGVVASATKSKDDLKSAAEALFKKK